MRILLTGSSGALGRTLAPYLKSLGHDVAGLDLTPGRHTDIVGSITERATVRNAVGDTGAEAIIHTAGLHAPHIARLGRDPFIGVNVTGTYNLLEEAVAQGVGRFVHTSTTSLLAAADPGDGAGGAQWLTEASPCLPRNIYGVTKLAAEHLCRVAHEEHGLPLVMLRPSRFFIEPQDRPPGDPDLIANEEANDFLYRRLTLEDAAEAHVLALDRAPELGLDTFMISAMPPFSAADREALAQDAPAVVARYFPDYPGLYAAKGWTMLPSIDCLYFPGHAARRLGFVCRTGFRQVLDGLAAEG
jgi:UDP-glucose 4-epimerase